MIPWPIVLILLVVAYLVGVGVAAARFDEHRSGCYQGGVDDCNDEPPSEGSGQ